MMPPFGRCSGMYLCTHGARKGKTFLFNSNICTSQKELPLRRPNLCISRSHQFIPYPSLYIPLRELLPLHKLNIWIFQKRLFLHSLSICISEGELLLHRSAREDSMSIPHTTGWKQVTSTEPGQSVHSLWKSALLILMLTGIFVVYLLVKPGPPQAVTLVDNLSQGLLEGVGLFLALPVWFIWGRRKGPSDGSLLPNAAVTNPSQRWVPFLLSLGILSYVIGQGIWTYNENIAHLSVLFPSWADMGFLGSYPFVLLAILLLPRRPLLVQTRVRILLDGLIIGTAYPLATLVLIFCLLLLAVRSQDREMQPIVLLLSLALITIVITDSIYDYLELHNLYATGGLLDVGWPLGYMLVGLSARGMQLHLTSRRPSAPSAPAPVPYPERGEIIGPPRSLERALIPLVFVSSVVLLLIWTKYEEANMALQAGVSLGVTIVLGLMVVRQVLLIQETISQNRLLHTIQQDLLVRNEALRQANVQLEAQTRLKVAYEEQRRLNEMKDQFILNVSHELRTPLTQVYGYLELLEIYHHTLTSDKQMGYIHKALQGCAALVPLIDTILKVGVTDSHMNPLQAEELFVADVMHEVLEEFKPLDLQGHPVDLEIAEGLVVQADPQSLCQVLRNLLSNAFKYTPPPTPALDHTRGGNCRDDDNGQIRILHPHLLNDLHSINVSRKN